MVIKQLYRSVFTQNTNKMIRGIKKNLELDQWTKIPNLKLYAWAECWLLVHTKWNSVPLKTALAQSPCSGNRNEPGPFRFFKNLTRFWYQKKVYIFFHHSCMVTFTASKARKIPVLVVTTIQLIHSKVYILQNYNNLLMHPNCLIDLSEIWNQNFLDDEASFK